MQINSWDAWDTLVARRSVKDVYDETDNLFPIAENVGQVRPYDVIVSDYYDEALLKKALREICGLDNRLYVTESGKQDGTMWARLKREHNIAQHTGDNHFSDVVSPLRAGIRGVHSVLAPFTPVEQKLAEGFPLLTRLMREARLTTYDGQYRGNQLVQIEVNFPVLLMASVLLHRRVTEYVDATDVLMSSRDCCLWEQLQRKVCSALNGAYQTHYFYSGRPARLKASQSYLEYVNGLMGERPVVVDLCGWGRSLPVLVEQTRHSDALIWLLSKYPDRGRENRVLALADGPNIRAVSSLIERANLARHPMAIDVHHGNPVFFNPLNIYWRGVPEIATMHRAFAAALNLTSRYAVATEAAEKGDDTLVRTIDTLFTHWRDYNSALRFQDDMMAKEEPAIIEAWPELAL